MAEGGRHPRWQGMSRRWQDMSRRMHLEATRGEALNIDHFTSFYSKLNQDCLLIALLRCYLHIVKFTHYKCT